jgi:PAS domain S-box-containing protein
MNNPNILARWRTNQKRTALQLDDVAALLDLAPQATFLVDAQDLTIILANAHASELTALMRTELIGLDLTSILGSIDEDVSPGEILRSLPPHTSAEGLYILSRMGRKIFVTASVTYDGRMPWMVISIETERQREQKTLEEQRTRNLWKNMRRLAFAPQSDSVDISLEQILEVAVAITGADIAAIFQAHAEQTMLERTHVRGDLSLLAENAHPQDLMNLQLPGLWNRRMHTTTQMQEQARISGLAYVASAPLGQAYARIGMLVLAGKTSPPAFIIEALDTLSAHITNAIEIIMRTQQLQEHLLEKDYEVQTANQIKDLIQDNLILLTPELDIFDLNQAALNSLGYTRDEIIGQPVERILISSYNLTSLLARALQGQASPDLEEIRLYRRNGQAFPANVRVMPCQVQRQSLGALILFEDLSEQEKYRKRTEVLEQRAVLGEVTASFAHEVRNPINNLSTGLQLLEFNLPPDDPNQDNIRRLQQDCNRLTNLVKSGLSFIRPMEYKMEPLHLGDLIEGLLASWRYRLERTNIQYQLVVEPGLPLVEGDHRALDQILTNLVNNAIDSMSTNEPEHKRILGIQIRHINQTSELDLVEAAISDTGSGIPEEIRDRIFEPFFTTKAGGTGIGLAIVKRIVTAHKGSIDVQSVPGGTVFMVRLPVLREKSIHS